MSMFLHWIPIYINFSCLGGERADESQADFLARLRIGGDNRCGDTKRREDTFSATSAVDTIDRSDKSMRPLEGGRKKRERERKSELGAGQSSNWRLVITAQIWGSLCN